MNRQKRARLFRLIEELVKWENTTNQDVLESEPGGRSVAELAKAPALDNSDHPRATELFDPERLPAFHDPFAGGGALPSGGAAAGDWRLTRVTSTRWRC